MATYKGRLEDASGNLMLPISTDIATPQLSATATQSFAKGDYLYYNNTLYKVTSAISSGGTIQPGTNCTATTVGAELKAVNQSGGGKVKTGIFTPGATTKTVTVTGLNSIQRVILYNKTSTVRDFGDTSHVSYSGGTNMKLTAISGNTFSVQVASAYTSDEIFYIAEGD